MALNEPLSLGEDVASETGSMFAWIEIYLFHFHKICNRINAFQQCLNDPLSVSGDIASG